MQILSGALAPTSTHKRREWTYLDVAGMDRPTVTVVQARSARPGAACEADTYEVDEDLAEWPPVRRFVLLSRADGAFYEVTVGPAGRCTCDGFRGKARRCKHLDAVTAVLAEGGLPTDAEAMDRAWGPAAPSVPAAARTPALA